ncbi:cell growth regulator with EF hand domain protein 1 isoform X5 [Bos indicus]|uniref:Cell growth regulator with EF hand domain protein 1 isoform X5 n=1 Tax=Bos indicus TaxID=9915 RepID=A0ABM4T4T7_BOSIN
MGRRRTPELYRAPFPLYALRVDPSAGLLIAAGGGGAAKTGIKNGVHFLQLEQINGRLSASLLHSHDTETRATMNLALAGNILAAGQDAHCQLLRFQIHQQKGKNKAEKAVTGMMLPVKMRTLLLLLLPLSQAAPKDGTMRLDPEAQHLPLPNPFEPGQEQLRLLQSYLKGLERMEEEPEHMSREQVLLYLFALHDYDQSGQLDGLELLSMLTAALAPGASDSPTTNPVILVVDKVLETQDLNGDGLMTPAELVNFPGEAPRHTEPREPPEPQDVEMQPLLAKSPSRQEEHDALNPGEAAGGQAEARREFLEPVQEAGGQADAVREAPGPGGEVGGQVETGDAGERAEELLGETLGSKNSPNELEVHAIQLENSEM